jgi:hypothetical protein
MRQTLTCPQENRIATRIDPLHRGSVRRPLRTDVMIVIRVDMGLSSQVNPAIGEAAQE